MFRYCIRKFFKILTLFLIISIITFMVVRIIPGDPTIAYLNTFNLSLTEENINFIKGEMGLNKSLLEQYLIWIKNIFNLNLGKSYLTNIDVYTTMKTSFVYTSKLAIASILWILFLGFPLGITTALYSNKFIDRVVRGISLFGISLPKFWLGFLAINLFAIELKFFPISGAYSSWSIILPSFTLSLSYIAYYIRLIRNNMLWNLNQDYIKFAKIRGVKKSRIIFHYAFKNSLNPIITSLGMNIGSMLSGAVIVENIFAWPGIGRLIVEAIDGRDYPVIQGYILLVSIVYIISNALADIFCYYLDPRIRKDI